MRQESNRMGVVCHEGKGEKESQKTAGSRHQALWRENTMTEGVNLSIPVAGILLLRMFYMC